MSGLAWEIHPNQPTHRRWYGSCSYNVWMWLGLGCLWIRSPDVIPEQLTPLLGPRLLHPTPSSFGLLVAKELLKLQTSLMSLKHL